MESIVKVTGIDLGKFRLAKDPDAAFTYLRRKFEDAGIFVLLLGNLGSFHTDIDVRAFRGLALADPHAPFVVINDQDARTAWSFTLLHEACHLWLGESGVSAIKSEFASEKFCNEVASAFLLPQAEMAEEGDLRGVADSLLAARISDFAASRNISSTLVAYRFFVSGRIGEAQWEALEEHYRIEWRRQREVQKEDRTKAKKETGPSYYVVKRHRLGDALISAASRGMLEGTLTATKAGRMLGVAPRNVYPLLAPANGRAAT